MFDPSKVERIFKDNDLYVYYRYGDIEVKVGADEVHSKGVTHLYNAMDQLGISKIKQVLEDREDLTDIEAHKDEPLIPFEEVVTGLGLSMDDIRKEAK